VPDILRCDYRLPGRSKGRREFVAIGLGDGLGRYRLTSAGHLFRIDPLDPTAYEPCLVTGVVRLRSKGQRTDNELFLTFISGKVKVVHIAPVCTREVHAKELKALACEEHALRQVVDRTTQKMFTHLRKVDPEIAQLAMLVFDDKKKAATWLTRPHLLLGMRSPLDVIAHGRRRVVLQTLNAILNGFPT